MVVTEPELDWPCNTTRNQNGIMMSFAFVWLDVTTHYYYLIIVAMSAMGQSFFSVVCRLQYMFSNSVK